MIWNVIRINVRRLLHNRAELLLTFVVPIAFFSVFALIFGGGLGTGALPKVKVVLVDEVQSDFSRSIEQSLRDHAGLRFMMSAADQPLGRQQAEQLVRTGKLGLAIVVCQQDSTIKAQLLSDASDQVAPQVVSAIVGKSMMVARSKTAIPLPPAADVSLQTVAKIPQPPIEVIDVLGEDKENPIVSMYAAGIAVMFLLFGATGGGGALLEERENQTLDRLLSTQMTMDQLLLGKWFYLSMLGIVQVTVMFLWGQIVFGVNLVGHLDGFLVMTIVTALAAASFGLFLATLCKSRGQLSGLSVILILTMSALGGSMVPRYLMSERMREFGMWTFNAWALDGFNKIFWRDLPLSSLTPQLSVLTVSALVFLVIARVMAVRWEFD